MDGLVEPQGERVARPPGRLVGLVVQDIVSEPPAGFVAAGQDADLDRLGKPSALALDAHLSLQVQLTDDLDGDAHPEILIVSLVNGPIGGVYLVLGKTANAASHVELGSADCIFNHPTSDVDFDLPLWARFVGDLDRRGLSDLLFGAPYDATAFLFFSEDIDCSERIDIRTANATLVGTNWFGAGTYGGDVDGDEREELMVGDYDGDGSLFLFGNGSVREGEHDAATSAAVRVSGTSGDGFTRGGVSVGDIDGDGLDDLAIGEASLRGTVYLFLGGGLPAAGGMTTGEADAVFEGQYHDDEADTHVLLRDVDGDGVGDLLIIAPGHDTGSGYLWFGMGLSRWGNEDVEDADTVFIGHEAWRDS